MSRSSYQLILVACLLCTTLTFAQQQIPRSVLAGGVAHTGDGTIILNGTIGQALIGPHRPPLLISGTTLVERVEQVSAGFWPVVSPSVIPGDSLPSLPFVNGAATAEVYDGDLYLFGGGNHWWGTVLYPLVYKFDGATWIVQDSIPDNNVWGMQSVIVGETVYLLAGWRRGSRLVRSYNLLTGAWTDLSWSPNAAHWGTTASYVSGKIYQFVQNGQVYLYDISTDSWDAGAQAPEIAYSGMASAVHQEEIYVIGYQNNSFYKYTPATDQWTVLASTPYPVAGCAMEILGDSIYCIGGSPDGSPNDLYDTTVIYSLSANTWTLSTSRLCAPRFHIASAIYKGQLRILGGLDNSGNAVDIVEAFPWACNNPLAIDPLEQLPERFILNQNYPNPFNPSTTIRFALPAAATVSLNIFDVSGRRIRRLIDTANRSAGWHEVVWDGMNEQGNPVSSGMYFYRLSANDVGRVGKMLLVR